MRMDDGCIVLNLKVIENDSRVSLDKIRIVVLEKDIDSIEIDGELYLTIKDVYKRILKQIL